MTAAVRTPCPQPGPLLSRRKRHDSGWPRSTGPRLEAPLPWGHSRVAEPRERGLWPGRLLCVMRAEAAWLTRRTEPQRWRWWVRRGARPRDPHPHRELPSWWAGTLQRSLGAGDASCGALSFWAHSSVGKALRGRRNWTEAAASAEAQPGAGCWVLGAGCTGLVLRQGWAHCGVNGGTGCCAHGHKSARTSSESASSLRSNQHGMVAVAGGRGQRTGTLGCAPSPPPPGRRCSMRL